MNPWIIVAAVGGVLSMVGFVTLTRQYRRGDINSCHLLTIVLPYLAFITFALASALRPELISGPMGIALWVPVLIAIGLPLVHRQRRARRH